VQLKESNPGNVYVTILQYCTKSDHPLLEAVTTLYRISPGRGATVRGSRCLHTVSQAPSAQARYVTALTIILIRPRELRSCSYASPQR